jgi:hypothetical protein
MEISESPLGEKWSFKPIKVEMIVGYTANIFCCHNTNNTPQDYFNQIVLKIR